MGCGVGGGGRLPRTLESNEEIPPWLWMRLATAGGGAAGTGTGVATGTGGVGGGTTSLPLVRTYTPRIASWSLLLGTEDGRSSSSMNSGSGEDGLRGIRYMSFPGAEEGGCEPQGNTSP